MPGFDVYVRSEQSREWFASRWSRLQKVGLGFLGKLGILSIAGDICQACPLKNEGTSCRETVGGVAERLTREVEVICGYAGGCIKAKGESIC